jgi:uncharacterized protein
MSDAAPTPHASIGNRCPARRARRDPLIDALRAFALFGILQVNIQSFLHGAGDPLGYFLEPPRALDTAVYLLVGTFVSVKFIGLFAFLFGLGFALQMRKLRQRYGRDGARDHYRRRLAFLLAVGIAHGTLLYYGDILTTYALAGFVLVLYSEARPARLLRATRNFFIGHAVLAVLLLVAGEWARRSLPADGSGGAVPPAVTEYFGTMVAGGWFAQLPLRVDNYLALLGTSVMTGMPFILCLFTLGALAGRLGWLTHPGRHRRLWRAALPVGVAGLVLSALGTWLNYRAMLYSPGDPPTWGYLLQGFGFPALALYLAWIVALRDAPWLRWSIAWLAPAGRMPLTNYLMQSLILGVLLTGWGLGWGAWLGRIELALLALVIVVLQIAASRWWMRRFAQGPVEVLWRRVTY